MLNDGVKNVTDGRSKGQGNSKSRIYAPATFYISLNNRGNNINSICHCHLSFVFCHLSFILCLLSFVFCYLALDFCDLSFSFENERVFIGEFLVCSHFALIIRTVDDVDGTFLFIFAWFWNCALYFVG